MEKDEIKFSLLEIMEGPKRINSISHTLLFDYLLEATQEQDRFEAFMRLLQKNAWWAYYGICIMASDILPTDSLFEEEKDDLQDALRSPLPGTIVDIPVKVGLEVKEGDTLIVLEAMKMDNNLTAERDGKIKAILVNEGDAVKENTPLVTFE